VVAHIKEILAADIKNIETQIADLNKEIETYTKQLATLLEYINADNK
jgi:flagellar capping protein FliD